MIRAYSSIPAPDRRHSGWPRNLLEKGIDAPKIIEETFYAKSYAQNLVMGRALMESILFLNGTGIASFIRRDVMEFYGVGTERSGRNCKPASRVTEGVEVAVYSCMS